MLQPLPWVQSRVPSPCLTQATPSFPDPYSRLLTQSSEGAMRVLIQSSTLPARMLRFGSTSSTAGLTLLPVSYNVRLRLMPHGTYRMSARNPCSPELVLNISVLMITTEGYRVHVTE